MKYYDIDLPQLLPANIPINSTDHVEYSGFINEFFLRGFNNYYSQFFNKVNNSLSYDFAKSCMCLYSLYAAFMSSDSQLENHITETGSYFYPENAHETNSYFTYDINTMPIGCVDSLQSYIKYVANSYALNADITYEGFEPYIYGLMLRGDLTVTSNIQNITDRLLQLLVMFTPAHTKLGRISYIDDATDLNVYAAVVCDDASYSYEAHLPVPSRERIVIGRTTTVPTGTTKLVSNYWWMDNFQNASGMANLWTPNEFASNVNDLLNMVPIDGTEFNEAMFINDGSSKDLRNDDVQLQLKMYNSKPEMYTSVNDAVNDPTKCGIIVVPGYAPTWTGDTEWELPSTLYSINGTSVTWNQSHILYNLLSGQFAYAVVV